MIERMGFVNKNVKAAIINMFKYLEENILGKEGKIEDKIINKQKIKMKCNEKFNGSEK